MKEKNFTKKLFQTEIEIEEIFDPSQETIEEYLRRISLRPPTARPPQEDML